MGNVRITSGTLRGRRVATPAGQGTRPLLTRLRKSLADLLRPRLPGARVLDLFGGSGAVALELLSNGAREAVVVERDRAVAELVSRNARDLGMEGRLRVVADDVLRACRSLGRAGERFQVVLVMPPYHRGLQQAALEAVVEAGVADPDGVVVVQRHRREARAEHPGARLVRTRTYGNTAFDFYEIGGGDPS